MVRVEAATVSDCRALAATSKRAFDHDVHFGAPGLGGPPGYDSPVWHRRALVWGQVFKLVRAARVVGGAIVIPRGTGAELGRIWLEPTSQGQGWGTAAMRAVETRFPDVRRWTLETPCWNLRTQRFYAKLGYQEVRRTPTSVWYEKLTATEPTAPAVS